MIPATMTHLTQLAGGIHAAIIAANAPLPGRLKVRQHLASVPAFIRHIFYVHWMYIVLVLGMFTAVCFAFPRDLAGGSALGRFLSAFLAGFWLLRIVLQLPYYARVRRAIRVLDALYIVALLSLVSIFGWAAVRPAL